MIRKYKAIYTRDFEFDDEEHDWTVEDIENHIAECLYDDGLPYDDFHITETT